MPDVKSIHSIVKFQFDRKFLLKDCFWKMKMYQRPICSTTRAGDKEV
jgi:hypothetical protein